MSSSLVEEKEKIRSEIREFLRTHQIAFEENEEEIRIKGRIVGAEIFNLSNLDIKIANYTYLTVDITNDKIILGLRITYPEDRYFYVKIEKNPELSSNPKIYYFDSTLYFWF